MVISEVEEKWAHSAVKRIISLFRPYSSAESSAYTVVAIKVHVWIR